MIKQYFIIINCLLILTAAYIGVKTFYQIVGARLNPAGPQITVREKDPVPLETRQQPLSHYDDIARRNLFDVSDGKAKTAESVDLESLEQTNLNLKLWGTVTGDKKEAYAVIEDAKERSQNLYREGDSIQTAVVKLILREKVVLRVDGKDEVLEMEKSQGGGLSRMAQIEPGPRPASVRRSGTQTISLRRSQIDNALKNVNDLMQQVKIMPHFDNGQADGFSLTGIRPNSLVRKMGLRNGDIITGVNGKKIETMDDALGFYQQLGSSDQISIQMKRRGRERTIDYNIK